MSDPGQVSSVKGQLWRNLIANPAPKSPWPSAVRRGLIVAAIMAIGAITGHLPQAAVISMGALNMGFVDGAVPRRTLTEAMLTVTVLTCLATFVAALAAGTWWTVPLLFVLALVYGTITGSGMVALNAGFMSLLTAIIFTNYPSDVRSAAGLAGWVLVGSIIQALASTLAWRRERQAAVRRSVLIATAALRALIFANPPIERHNLDTATVEVQARQTLNGARLPPEQHTAYASVLSEMSWTRMHVATWLSTGHPTREQRDFVAAAIDQVQADVHRQGHRSLGPATNETGGAAGVVGGGAGAVNTSPASTAGADAVSGGGDQQWQILVDQLKVLEGCAQTLAAGNRQLRPGESPANNDASIIGRADRVNGVSDQLAALVSLFQPSKPMFAHGLRLAVAIAIAQSISVGFEVYRGYWIALTVAMVVKPDFASTLTRGLLRIVGTLASVTFVGILLLETHQAEWLLIGLIAVFAPLTMRWITGNYGLTAFAITTTVLVQVESIAPGLGTVEQRLLLTLLGAAIGIGAATLWPIWRGDDLPRLLVTALKTQEEWTVAVLRNLDRPGAVGPEKVRELGRASRDAMLSAQPAAQAALLEPHRAAADPKAAISVLGFCTRASLATAAIEVAVRSCPDSEAVAPPGAQTPTTGIATRFVADFDAAMAIVCSSDTDPATVAAAQTRLDSNLGSEVRQASSGDRVTDRALTQLVAAADSTLLAALTL